MSFWQRFRTLFLIQKYPFKTPNFHNHDVWLAEFGQRFCTMNAIQSQCTRNELQCETYKVDLCLPSTLLPDQPSTTKDSCCRPLSAASDLNLLALVADGLSTHPTPLLVASHQHCPCSLIHALIRRHSLSSEFPHPTSDHLPSSSRELPFSAATSARSPMACLPPSHLEVVWLPGQSPKQAARGKNLSDQPIPGRA